MIPTHVETVHNISQHYRGNLVVHVDILSGCILSVILCMYLFTENKISCTLIFQEIVKVLQNI